jgi:hypothetical protein
MPIVVKAAERRIPGADTQESVLVPLPAAAATAATAAPESSAPAAPAAPKG